MAAIIEASGVYKSFNNDGPVVQDLSFSIQRGDIYGFLGKNGAGKSTTMRILLDLIRPDEDSVKIQGQAFTSCSRTGSIM